jgi:hypothetical protein
MPDSDGDDISFASGIFHDGNTVWLFLLICPVPRQSSSWASLPRGVSLIWIPEDVEIFLLTFIHYI